MATTFPSICQIVVLPEKSIEKRSIRAIKLARGTGPRRRGVLFLGGVHAREVMNPDMLVSLGINLCKAYTSGDGLTFGGKSFSAETIQLLINAMDIFIFPLVNPDGRAFVQSPTGDAFWRKNRNPNPGFPKMGVDINRNFNFLHSSGLDTTATNSGSDVFRGDHPFSEPETRNVKHMLDAFPNIMGMVDVHSFSQLVLYPWGDDVNQTADPEQNFLNPDFDGLRGTNSDAVYKEFIPRSDLDAFVKIGNRIKESIRAVRGRSYTVEQSAFVYNRGISADSSDYSYSRHFVDTGTRKVLAFAFETGTEFQPLIPEAMNVIAEGSAGLIEFCMACLCVADHTLSATALAGELEEMRDFRDEEMLATPAGCKYVELLEENGIELMQIMAGDEKLRKQVIKLAGSVNRVVRSRNTSKPKTFSAAMTSGVEKLLQSFASKASPELKKAITEVRKDLKHFRGRTVLDGLKAANYTRSNTRG